MSAGALPGGVPGLVSALGMGLAGAGFFHWLFQGWKRRLSGYGQDRSSARAAGTVSLAVHDAEVQRAGRLWGVRAQERQNSPVLAWTDSPLVNELYIHPTISGVGEDNWVSWVILKYFPRPVRRALSICCGDGPLERYALRHNVIARRFDAFDASEGAIEIARKRAEETGIARHVNYAVADVNHFRLKPRIYDAVFSAMGLHHIKELEHALGQIGSSLKPAGLFILNEFVGPNQFQWTPLQVRLANEQLEKIPERYKKSLLTGVVKNRVLRQTIEEMTAGDPTESIRSSEIVPLVYRMFEVVERIDYGGTILNLVLEQIAGNFQGTPEDIAILHPLFDTERRLLRDGVIPSDFTLIIARRRDGD